MEELYTRVLQVRALLGGSNSPTSRSPEAVDWIMCVVLQGGRTLVPEEGVAYIECARTPVHVHYKGLNVHKGRALLVMTVLNTLNAHED